MNTPFLTRLMTRSKLCWSWKIDNEQRLCIEFANAMRAYTLDGTYTGIWGHIANEGKRHRIVAQILKAMGMIPGSADYFFIWLKGGGFIEFKVRGNSLNANQKDYREWCEYSGIRYGVAYSAQEGEQLLKAWGALK